MPDPRNDPNSFALRWPLPAEAKGLTAADRLDYWRVVGHSAAFLKDRDLARGLDKDGRPLLAITQYTMLHRKSAMGHASPSAPPLTPAYAVSRTRSLLRYKAFEDQVVFYWDFDPHTGESWGVILGYHRDGIRGRHRDVIGLSPSGTAQAKREGEKWLKAKLAREPQADFVATERQGGPSVYTARPVVHQSYAPKPVYDTGYRSYRGGKFVPVATRGMHLDRSF